MPTAGAETTVSTPAPAGIWVLVDGWVRDARVRRDVLIGLGMVLAAVVCTAAALVSWAEPLLRQVLTNTIAQIAAGAAAAGGLGYGGLRRMRRRRAARSR
ncbi:hypothetical protein AB0E55_22845 [Amycolatopsis keratiniphila]|uniref:hypothetical protein n=1 Tax=Amycolatopsis keratiniphila TaxID=129921 RepID=UPI0033EE5191